MERRWYCPRCHQTDVTRRPEPHSRLHACAGLKGITAPFLPDGVAGTLVTVERGDYVGTEEGIRYDDDGRAVMAVNTIREDGQDCTVFAPTARAITS